MENLQSLNPAIEESYMLISEASRLYDIPMSTLRAWVLLKKIKAIKVRGRVLLDKAELDVFSRIYVRKEALRTPHTNRRQETLNFENA